MPDKLRDLFPIPITWASGEQPSAAKLSGWANQTNRALEAIEKALGDMHSDFHPLFASSTNTPIPGWARSKAGIVLNATDLHLQILSLARLVGPSSVLNPRILGGVAATITGEPLPSDTGEFYLRFIPDHTIGSPPTWSNTTKFATIVASPDLVVDEGDYYVDFTTGKVIVHGAESGMGTVEYNVATGSDNMLDSFHGASFNVFPGPQQSVKCTVAASGSAWRLTLPVLTDQQADWGHTSTTLTALNDLNYNVQLFLPFWITNEYSATEAIADNLMAVWDETEKRVISGSFTYVSSTAVDYTGETLIAGSNRYSLILSGGTDLTRMVDDLRSRAREHKHDGTNKDMRIDHSDLSELAVGGVAGAEYYSFFDDGQSGFPNHHPQYLGRWGRDGSNSQNAMLGNILFAATAGGQPSFGLGSNSFGLFFGDFSTGPALYYSFNDDALLITNKNLLVNNNIIAGDDVVADNNGGGGNFKWVNTKTESVVIDSSRAEFPTGSAFITKNYALSGSDEEPYVWVTTTGYQIFLDITSYVPNGAIITSIDVDQHFDAGTATIRALDMRLYNSAFGTASAAAAFTDQRTPIGTTRAAVTFSSINETVDKDNRLYLSLKPSWSGGSSFWLMYSVRINLSFNTILRGG